MNNTQLPETTVRIPCRFSYVHVWEPWAGNAPGSIPAYQVQCLVDPKYLPIIKKAVAKAALAKWRETDIPKMHLRMPWRDGTSERAGDPNYAGLVFINAKNQNPVPVVDKNSVQITDRAEFYSGCRGIVVLNFFAYDTAGNRGVGTGLSGIMKLSDDERLDGRPTAQQMFSDVDDGVTADAFKNAQANNLGTDGTEGLFGGNKVSKETAMPGGGNPWD